MLHPHRAFGRTPTVSRLSAASTFMERTMSLAFETCGAKGRTAKPRPAAKKKPAPRVKPRVTPEPTEIEILAQRFIAHLDLGEHEFAVLRQDFAEWCEIIEVEPPSAPRFAAWLKAAGLKKHRAGHAKITVYRKIAARPAMRLVA
jgi:hypothetical protein